MTVEGVEGNGSLATGQVQTTAPCASDTPGNEGRVDQDDKQYSSHLLNEGDGDGGSKQAGHSKSRWL